MRRFLSSDDVCLLDILCVTWLVGVALVTLIFAVLALAFAYPTLTLTTFGLLSVCVPSFYLFCRYKGGHYD